MAPERVIGHRCVPGRPASPGLSDGVRRVSFDRHAPWAEVVAALAEVEPEHRIQLQVAARGLFGVTTLSVGSARPGPQGWKSKAEAEAATCRGITLTATVDGVFVSEERRQREGGARQRPCCFDPDMIDVRDPARHRPGSGDSKCRSRPTPAQELGAQVEALRGDPTRCEFLVVAAQRGVPWGVVVPLLARFEDGPVLLEDAGRAPCPEPVPDRSAR